MHLIRIARLVDTPPGEAADPVELALVDLGPLNVPLLPRAEVPPHNHVPRACLRVGRNDEARVLRAERGCKHARAPRPPEVDRLYSAQQGMHGQNFGKCWQPAVLPWYEISSMISIW